MLRPIATIGIIALASLLILVGCESKINDENYALLAKGMSVSEVEGILGDGIDDSIAGVDVGGAGISGSGSSGRKTLRFVGDEYNIIVNFQEGKVTSFRKQ